VDFGQHSEDLLVERFWVAESKQGGFSYGKVFHMRRRTTDLVERIRLKLLRSLLVVSDLRKLVSGKMD
jgi:hypothetical protein